MTTNINCNMYLKLILSIPTLLLLLLLIQLPSTVEGNSKYLVAYYQGSSSMSPSQIDGSKMTHLIYAFATIDSLDSTVNFKNPSQELKPSNNNCQASGRLYEINQLKAKYPSLQLLLALGGYIGSNGFSAVVADDTARMGMVQKATRFMLDYGFDGIDIDWEFPVVGTVDEVKTPGSPQDGDNYIKLLQDFRNTWKQYEVERKFILSLALPPKPILPFMQDKGQDLSSLSDMINLMTYDMQYSTEGKVRPDANLYPSSKMDDKSKQFSVSSSVAAYMKIGFQPDKLVVGFPAYSRGFAGVQGGSNGLFGSFTDSTPVVIQKQISQLKADGFVEGWDDEMKASFLYSQKSQEWFSYESERAVKEKVSFIESKNLAGAMLWDLTIDTNFSSSDSVLGNLHRNMNDLLRVQSVQDCHKNPSSFCNVQCKVVNFQPRNSPPKSSGNVTPLGSISILMAIFSILTVYFV